MICRALRRCQKPEKKGCADFDTYAGVTFANFETLSQEQVSELINRAAKKSCPLDPMPTSVVLDVLDVLLPVITNIILDLSAAFDTIRHDTHLNRLKSRFGVDGKALEWFASYLADRTQRVTVNDGLSSAFPLRQGFPPGSHKRKPC